MGYTKYTSIDSILEMLNHKCSKGDITAALSSLEAMYADNNISEYRYKNVKKLLEDYLDDFKKEK